MTFIKQNCATTTCTEKIRKGRPKLLSMVSYLSGMVQPKWPM